MTNNFSGYVLAGGKSSRMGADKAFLQIGEKTFIENAARALKPNCRQVKIILNKLQTHFVEKLPENATHIFDRFENRGALGGIHAALKDCQTEFAVILAVDLPFVDESAIKRLCKIALDCENFSAVVPRQNDGKLQPLCAVYRIKNCLSKLENFLIKQKSAPVYAFLETIQTHMIDQERLSSDENLFVNINRPKDYRNFSL